MMPRLGLFTRSVNLGERGSAFLMCLTLVMIMTLLGIALFEMSAIEAKLAKSDVSDVQAFYCAEAEAARFYELYKPGDPAKVSEMWVDNSVIPIPNTALTLGNVPYTVSGLARIIGSRVVMVTATCTLPNGRTRTVQRNGTREFLSPIYQLGLATGGAQSAFADTVFGGEGIPVLIGGSLVGGADTINGDMYVAGNVYVRGQAKVAGYGTSDPATITVSQGKSVASTSAGFNAQAAGATAQGQLTPMPILSNPSAQSPEDKGVIDKIGAAVAGKMTGIYQGATVYNLGEIFKQLGATREGNRERNLARPSGCTFGVASTNVKCQIWQDLVILGPRQSESEPQSPTDKPTYFFMGLPRSPSVAPQGTSFDVIYAAAVKASPELQTARVHRPVQLARLRNWTRSSAPVPPERAGSIGSSISPSGRTLRRA